MATIDTSIYSNFQPPKISSPFELQAMMSQLQTGQANNRLAQMKFAEAEREDVERNMLAGAYRDYYAKPATERDVNSLYGSVAQGGGGHLLPGMMKTQNEADASGVTLANARLTGDKLRVDAAREQKKRAASVLGAMIADPSLTPEKVLQGIQDSDEASPEQKQKLSEMVRLLSPEQIRPWLNERLLEMQDPKDVYAAGNPKAGDKQPDKVLQYEYAKKDGFKGSFADFLRIVPEAQAGYMQPYRDAEAYSRRRGDDSDERRDNYNLPSQQPRQRPAGFSVRDPNGVTHNFTTQQQADAFKKAIGGR